MKGNEFLDKMELVDSSYVEAADAKPKSRRRKWTKWMAIAACLCLVVAGAFAMFGGNQSNTVQMWDSGYTAEEYFKFSDNSTDNMTSSSSSIADSAIPYDETRWLSDVREILESENVIPVIVSHPLFDFAVRYYDDGSLYCVEISWHGRDLDGIENYSDLKVIASYQEIEIIDDTISIEIDDEGNVLEPAVTVTERDGFQIIAKGRENTEKTLTFQNDNGWYQISGSWNDDYEPVVELLDWFWDHPLDFERFSLETGDNYTNSTLAEMPDAFAEYLPDFAAFGFIEGETYVSLKNGIPVRFEGHYVAHVSEEQVKNQSFYDVDGYTTIHWCISTEPDFYDLQGSVGNLEDLTQEQVVETRTNNENKIQFLHNGNVVIIYYKNAHEVWSLIESLQSQ